MTRLETPSETRYQLRAHAMQWWRNAVEGAIQGLRMDGTSRTVVMARELRCVTARIDLRW